jgi:hypothetical protein
MPLHKNRKHLLVSPYGTITNTIPALFSTMDRSIAYAEEQHRYYCCLEAREELKIYLEKKEFDLIQ